MCPLHPVSSGRGGAVPTQLCIFSDSPSGSQVNPFKTLLRTQGALTLLLVRVLQRNRTNIFIMYRDVKLPLWLINSLPAMQAMRVQSRSQEDTLEKKMATTHSSILAWEIPWTEEPGRLQSMGL